MASKSKVYFSKTITPEKLVEMFKILNKDLPGNIAIKIHSGEKGNFNFIKPEFLKPIVEYVKGTVVECNTAYPGSRDDTEKHLKVIDEHGWNQFGKFDLMDAEGPDDVLKVENGLLLKENLVGKNLKKYDSSLVIVHFKGHVCGGFGGALKQLSIGYASAAGRALQHSGGKTSNCKECWGVHCTDKEFKEAMADAASTIIKYFKGNLAYVALMVNMSIDCDCADKPAKPMIPDIGVLSSIDPVALDKACLDLLYNLQDENKKSLVDRIESKLGPYIIDCAVKLGLGNKDYELVNVD